MALCLADVALALVSLRLGRVMVVLAACCPLGSLCLPLAAGGLCATLVDGVSWLLAVLTECVKVVVG